MRVRIRSGAELSVISVKGVFSELTELSRSPWLVEPRVHLLLSLEYDKDAVTAAGLCL